MWWHDLDKPAFACVAVMHEESETECGEVITIPNYVQEENLNDVRISDEFTARQNQDV